MATRTKNTESTSLNGCSITITNGTDDVTLGVLSGDFTFQLPQYAKEPSKDRGVFQHWVRTEQLECQATLTIDLAEIHPSGSHTSIFQAIDDASATLKKTLAGNDPFDIVITFPVKSGLTVAETRTLENCVTASPVEVKLSSTAINSLTATVKYFQTSSSAAS